VLPCSTGAYVVAIRQITRVGPTGFRSGRVRWLLLNTYEKAYDRFQVYAELISRRHLVLAEALL